MLTCLLNKRRGDQDWRGQEETLCHPFGVCFSHLKNKESGMYRDFLVLRYEYTRSLRLLFKLYNQPSKWASLCLWVRTVLFSDWKDILEVWRNYRRQFINRSAGDSAVRTPSDWFSHRCNTYAMVGAVATCTAHMHNSYSPDNVIAWKDILWQKRYWRLIQLSDLWLKNS